MSDDNAWTSLDQVKAEFKEFYSEDALVSIPLKTDNMRDAVELRRSSIKVWFSSSDDNAAWIVGIEDNWVMFDARNCSLRMAVLAYLNPPKPVKDYA